MGYNNILTIDARKFAEGLALLAITDCKLEIVDYDDIVISYKYKKNEIWKILFCYGTPYYRESFFWQQLENLIE